MKSVYYDSNYINCHLGDFKPEENAPLMPENLAKKIKNGEGCNNCHRDTGHKNGLGVDTKFEARHIAHNQVFAVIMVKYKTSLRKILNDAIL